MSRRKRAECWDFPINFPLSSICTFSFCSMSIVYVRMFYLKCDFVHHVSNKLGILY